MKALVAVEVRRLLARRLTRLVAVLAALGIAVPGLVVFLVSNRNVEAALVTARAEQERAVQECLVNPEFVPEPRLQDPGFEREAFCRSQIAVQPRDPRFRLEQLTEIFKATSVPLVIVSWLLAASFVGAEWRAGTVATQLTWEPRRLRVIVAKALAAVLLAFVATAVWQAMLGGALVPAAALRGTTEGAGGAWLWSLAGVTLRAASVAALAAVLGLSIAAIGRNTAAALGAGFVYLAVIEGILRGVRPGWARWFLGDNAALFIDGRDTGFPPLGRPVAEAGALLSAYAVGVFAAAALQFRRRDVT